VKKYKAAESQINVIMEKSGSGGFGGLLFQGFNGLFFRGKTE
jgi:hypothetical protein